MAEQQPNSFMGTIHYWLFLRRNGFICALPI